MREQNKGSETHELTIAILEQLDQRLRDILGDQIQISTFIDRCPDSMLVHSMDPILRSRRNYNFVKDKGQFNIDESILSCKINGLGHIATFTHHPGPKL